MNTFSRHYILYNISNLTSECSFIVQVYVCSMQNTQLHVLAKHIGLHQHFITSYVILLNAFFHLPILFCCSSDVISHPSRPYILSHSHDPVSAHLFTNPWLYNCGNLFLKSSFKVLIQLCLNYGLVQQAKAAASFWKILLNSCILPH